MNTVTLIGRLTRDIEVRKTENDKSVANMSLAVQKPYKNSDGSYETDFIDITLWGSIAENTAEYCKKGYLVAVKGSLNTNFKEKDGKQVKSLGVVAEKVTFLAPAKDNRKKENVER